MNTESSKEETTSAPVSKNGQTNDSFIQKNKQALNNALQNVESKDIQLTHSTQDAVVAKVLSTTDIKEQEQNRESSPLPYVDHTSIKSLSLLPTSLPLLASRNFDLPAFNISENKALKTNSPKPITWQISLLGGVNTTRFSYQSNENTRLVRLKQSAETSEWGNSYGANISLIWKKKWLLNTGLEYHQLWSRFEGITVDTFGVLKENQLLKVWLDGATGDTLDTHFGNTRVSALATQSVLHYNQYRHFSIPLEIGMRRASGKLIYGLNAGVVFSFTTAQSGRTFGKGANLVYFKEGESSAAFKDFHVGLRLSPIVGYPITKNWNLFLQPQWTYKRRSGFDGTDVKIGIHQFNLNIGLGYSLQ